MTAAAAAPLLCAGPQAAVCAGVLAAVTLGVAAHGVLTSSDDIGAADDAADQDLSSTNTTECTGDCEDQNCPVLRLCFNKARYVGTPQEAVFDAQLAVQEASMNSMSPGQLISNRQRFGSMSRAQLERLPGVAQRKASVVAEWLRRNPGQTLGGSGLAVLHRLDMVAGGDPMGYYAIGDSGINSSLGRSWAHKTSQIDAHAQQLQQNGCSLMRVDLYGSAACP